jgi:hypothetical protein
MFKVAIIASVALFFSIVSEAKAQEFVNSWEEYDTSNCGSMQADFGRMVFNAAWPAATFINTYCTNSSVYRDGITYNRIAVDGTGFWGGYVITEFAWATDRHGNLVQWEWGDHNNTFWPPGTSAEITGSLIEGLLEDAR